MLSKTKTIFTNMAIEKIILNSNNTARHSQLSTTLALNLLKILFMT